MSKPKSGRRTVKKTQLTRRRRSPLVQEPESCRRAREQAARLNAAADEIHEVTEELVADKDPLAIDLSISLSTIRRAANHLNHRTDSEPAARPVRHRRTLH